jgi:hypothetical protein
MEYQHTNYNILYIIYVANSNCRQVIYLTMPHYLSSIIPNILLLAFVNEVPVSQNTIVPVFARTSICAIAALAATKHELSQSIARSS